MTRRASPTLAAGLWGTPTGARAPRSGAVDFPKSLAPAAASAWSRSDPWIDTTPTTARYKLVGKEESSPSWHVRGGLHAYSTWWRAEVFPMRHCHRDRGVRDLGARMERRRARDLCRAVKLWRSDQVRYDMDMPVGAQQFSSLTVSRGILAPQEPGLSGGTDAFGCGTDRDRVLPSDETFEGVWSLRRSCTRRRYSASIAAGTRGPIGSGFREPGRVRE